MKLRMSLLALVAMLAFVRTAPAQQQDASISGEPAFHAVTAKLLDIDKMVGEETCFTLTAKDANGNVIRSWNTSGNPTTLTLNNSTANTDSSTQSWSADPMGYSWAVITHNGIELTKISPNEWSLPASEFDSVGQCRICLVDSKAEAGVTISVTPQVTYLNQVTDKINFRTDVTTNYLVDLTSQVQGKDAVFQMRPYEIVVTPRDKFLNPTSETRKTRFSARWPGEFDNSQPGLADIFSGDVFITGPTNYLLASRVKRELAANDDPQWLLAYDPDNPQINGRTNPFEVLTHAPVDFKLVSPPDHSIITYVSYNVQENFTWEKPVPADPYTDIQVSRFSAQRYSDVVHYTWVIVDSVSLTHAIRIPSNNAGLEPMLTMTHLQLVDLMHTMAGAESTVSLQCAWYVDATDGLYVTLSSPPNKDVNQRPGYYLTINQGATAVQSVPASPTKLMLDQNYPNPFNPSTTIRFATPNAGRVTLRVYDLLGAEVATVVNENLDAGEHSVSFNASSLPSGTYIYKLQADGKVLTRRMTLMK